MVYSLHKAGEENPALVEKYIDAVAEVEKAIEEIKANMTDDERAEVEAQEAAENTEPEAAPAEDEEIEEEPIQLRGETKTCPSARPRSTATPCSATTVVLSCKIRQSAAFAEETLPTLDKSCDMCKMKRIAFLPKRRGL